MSIWKGAARWRRDSARRPCGDRNAVLRQGLREDALQLVRREEAEDHRLAAGRVDDRAARPHRLVRHAGAREEPGEVLAEAAPSSVAMRGTRTAGSVGRSPDHRVDPERHRRAVGQAEEVVEEAVGVVPEAAPVHRRRDPDGPLEERRDQVRVGRIRLASAVAIRSIDMQ
jgi:hypothetical protein